MSQLQDLIGQVFDKLTVIKYDGQKNKRNYWLCQCSCGNFISVSISNLNNGKTHQCHDCAKIQAASKHLVDLTNQKIGDWLVLYRADDYISPSGARNVRWHCRCSCGTEKDVAQSSLRNGDSKSCGCKSNRGYDKFIDLTGQHIGKLTVLYRSKNQKTRTMWHCRCDCGNECDVWAASLDGKHTLSCGCINSSLELHVANYLRLANIDYKIQVKFSDLTGIGNRQLSYDFGVYRNGILDVLVECQGKQHYEPQNHFGGKEQFEVQQFHDELKREYARKHGIKLIEVPYTFDTYEKVEEFLLKELSLPDKS